MTADREAERGQGRRRPYRAVSLISCRDPSRRVNERTARWRRRRRPCRAYHQNLEVNPDGPASERTARRRRRMRPCRACVNHPGLQKLSINPGGLYQSALRGGDAVGDHAEDGERHAGGLPRGDDVAQEQPAAEQHQDRLAVPQNLSRRIAVPQQPSSCTRKSCCAPAPAREQRRVQDSGYVPS